MEETLNMTGIANALTVRNSSILAIQPVGACIASPLHRRCFPVRILTGAERCAQLRSLEKQ